MIFWILTAVIAVAWLMFVVHSFWEGGFWYGLAQFVICGMLAGVIWVLVPGALVTLGGNELVGANRVTEEPVALKALASDRSVEGRSYFLGSGYMEGKRVLSYIKRNDDGSFTPDQVDGSDSSIYEVDGVDPSMVIVSQVADHWWLAPPTVVGTSYEFVVPVGSVSEGFSVTP